MKSEDYFLISLVLFVGMWMAIFFGAGQDPYLNAACLHALTISAFLSAVFFVSGMIKKIVEVRKS